MADWVGGSGPENHNGTPDGESLYGNGGDDILDGDAGDDHIEGARATTLLPAARIMIGYGAAQEMTF